jgi:hypothetical protein
MLTDLPHICCKEDKEFVFNKKFTLLQLTTPNSTPILTKIYFLSASLCISLLLCYMDTDLNWKTLHHSL